MKLNYILCAAPGQTRDAARYGLPMAHMAWQIGSSLSLVEGGISASMRGGFMVLGDALYDGGGRDPGQLIDKVAQECVLRAFDGVVFDLEQTRGKMLEHFVSEGAPYLIRRGLRIYLPEKYASCCPNAMVLIPTAMMSGSLSARLRDAVERYGYRVALEMERLSRDIALPSPNSAGTHLQRRELSEYLTQRGGVSFFSQEMCSRYFTYKTTQGGTHFVLFDDAACIQKKAQLAQRLGVEQGFLLYPEVDDILPALVEQG